MPCQYLYGQISGDRDLRAERADTDVQSIHRRQRAILLLSAEHALTHRVPSNPVTAIRDPFGNSYGYSTANQRSQWHANGYNPTFDLWSTAGLARTGNRSDPSGSKTGKLVGRFCETPSLPTASDTDALQFRGWLRTSLRSCAPRLRRGDWDFALRLSRWVTNGISSHRSRAFGFAPD